MVNGVDFLYGLRISFSWAKRIGTQMIIQARTKHMGIFEERGMCSDSKVLHGRNGV